MPRNTRKDEECCEGHWHSQAKKDKLGFALFLLVVGGFWLAKDMGYLVSLPFWPLVVIFFALFLLLSKM